MRHSRIVSSVLLGGFFLLESFIRTGERAESLDGGTWDRRSTKPFLAVVALAITLALPGAAVLNSLRLGRFVRPTLGSQFGIPLMISGLALRLWSVKTLGACYTRRLLVTGGQWIVNRGPYRVVRHPGYLGSLSTWVGAGLVSANWLVTIVVGCLMVIAYDRRIRIEESMLLEVFGDEYRAYAARTWKLLPLIY